MAGVEGLRPCKRYITGHDKDGKSVYIDSQDQVYQSAPFGGTARSYAVSSVPAELTNDVDVEAYKSKDGPTSFTRNTEVVLQQPGVNLVIVDVAPGAVSALHQTVSIDYAVCVVGELEHELDNGEVVRLLPGDHIVQRGTMHLWRNASKTQPARMIAATVPCVPFNVAGKELKEEWVV